MNNSGFLSTQNVRESQLANLSKQIDWLKEENDRLEDFNEELMEERNRLNNIIKRLEVDLRNMYLTFGEFSEEYTENCIKKLKGESNEED